MKKIVKLFVAMRSIAIIAFVAVIGFSMIACDDSDKGKDEQQQQETDSFAGAWISSNQQRIEASWGNWKYQESVMSVHFSCIRGTYTVSGNNVSLVITEVNTSFMSWDQQTVYPGDTWTAYANLSSEMKSEIPQTLQITITNNRFTYMGDTFSNGL
ncbi:hypothetical protein [Treponema sp. R80B11-R83G3]